MKQSRLSEEQTIGLLKQNEAGVAATQLGQAAQCREQLSAAGLDTANVHAFSTCNA